MAVGFMQIIFNKNLLIVLLAICNFWLPVSAQTKDEPLVLPTKYDEDRFYIQPVTLDGITLNFFMDTGGSDFIYSDVVEQSKLSVIKKEIPGGKGDMIETVKIPKFRPNADIPPPFGKETLRIANAKYRGEPCSLCSKDWSGMLGTDWFAGRVWTFDYPNRRLLLRSGDDFPKNKEKHRVTLGFQTDASGKRLRNYPRIQATIDGEQIDFLFDTGATILLSDEALATLNDGRQAVRAANFITATIFDKWRKLHPRWQVIERANIVWGKEEAQAMIKVPQITIAGYTVGPVWFTRQRDAVFHEYMSKAMDKRIDGAIGGNTLRHFRITIDYPRAVAVFER